MNKFIRQNFACGSTSLKTLILRLFYKPLFQLAHLYVNNNKKIHPILSPLDSLYGNELDLLRSFEIEKKKKEKQKQKNSKN